MRRRWKVVIVVTGIPLLVLSALLVSFYRPVAGISWMASAGTSFRIRPYTEGEVETRYQEAADRARDLLRDHVNRIDVPAFSAAVAVDGVVVWSAASGHAEVESERKATPDTLLDRISIRR
ncbi:MAG: hypothetical protein U5R48_19415 [Gammaproteobacteria bacterium]|nr:hypothetical protein [Gammaproteobacteria bacterium]